MVPAQSRNIDQVRIVVILFYPLFGQMLNPILNLVVCLLDLGIIFWSDKRFKCAALNELKTSKERNAYVFPCGSIG